jgi:hypothetical protein
VADRIGADAILLIFASGMTGVGKISLKMAAFGLASRRAKRPIREGSRRSAVEVYFRKIGTAYSTNYIGCLDQRTVQISFSVG